MGFHQRMWHSSTFEGKNFGVLTSTLGMNIRLSGVHRHEVLKSSVVIYSSKRFDKRSKHINGGIFPLISDKLALKRISGSKSGNLC